MVSQIKTLEKPLVSYLNKHPKRKRSQTIEVGRKRRKVTKAPKRLMVTKGRREEVKSKVDDVVEWTTKFLEDPIDEVEAKNIYNPHEEEMKLKRNLLKKYKKDGEHEELIVQAKKHYKKVIVDDQFVYELNDDAHVQSEVEEEPFICKIVELFKGVDGIHYFTAQWFYRAIDTALPPSTTITSRASSTISTESEVNGGDVTMLDADAKRDERAEATLLDLYSGCGAMSTGLTMGAELAGLNLVTVWLGEAENFLSLLIEWEKLCVYFSLTKGLSSRKSAIPYRLTNAKVAGENFQVVEVLDICIGDPKRINKPGLYFKVRWLGDGSSRDTWEPIKRIRNCKDKIQEFVERVHESNIIPLPGGVDVVCGGPPCQGVSGHNRNRNSKKPLDDNQNKQLKVFMDIVGFLKPKYVLMENVVDMLKFAKGFMARYAVGRLIKMDYQTRMGMMAAGAYGLAQYRMRYFLWGARSNEVLPQFPLPTHDVKKRGGTPVDFKCNLVAYEEGHTVSLAPRLLLKDIISDLPRVKDGEDRDEMPYGKAPKTPFQECIRSSKNEMVASSSKSTEQVLYNHIPLNLEQYDYKRVRQIPKKKGACLRDLRGLRVGPKNVIEYDPAIKRIFFDPETKEHPLVPTYAMSFEKGKSLKPFGRLWWDETVGTVVTRAEPHNQIILHPVQDRVLTIRENTRLQGFPDYYKLFGPTKAKYCQVGNAVAVPAAKALGFALGKAFLGLSNSDPLMILPTGFPVMNEDVPSESSENSS